MMKLTDELKEQIDSLDYQTMLSRWRFAPSGDPMFVGEIGNYFSKRMFALRDADPEAAAAISKSIGWER